MKTKFAHKNAHLQLKWKCDLDRSVIEDNCEERGWERVEEPDDQPFPKPLRADPKGSIGQKYKEAEAGR